MSGGSERLLARGGRPLGLAAVAFARGQRPGEGPWYALAPELVAPAEEVLSGIGRERDPAVLSAALAAALGPDPATAAPGWLGPLDRVALERLAEAPGLGAPPPALERECEAPSDRGLWALALAFCRNPDAVAAVAARLEDAPGASLLVRWSRLAQILARPGDPSRARRRIREILAAAEPGDG